MLAEVSYSREENALTILEELYEFQTTKQHCDFVIKVGSKEIHVHRNVICANSEFFKAMLTYDTKEKQTGCVELKDMDEECVKICADFLYCRKIIIDEEKREELLGVSDFLQLWKFRDSIAKYYEENLDENSFYATKKLAATYHCFDLEEKCDLFAVKNFELIAQLAEFKNLTKEYVAYLLESDENETSATNKVKAMLNWVRHDAASRSSFLLPMLGKTDLSEVSVRYKQYLLHRDSLISESLVCVKLLCDSFMCGVTPNPGESTLCKTDAIILFDDSSRHLQHFNPEDGTLTQMQKLREDFQVDSFSAVSLKEFIYVLMLNRLVYRLDTSKSEASWEQMPSMNFDHGKWPPATVDENYVYVVGRWFGFCHNIEIFDPCRNTWASFTVTGIRSSCTPVALHSCIYCIGGKENNEFLREVRVFDVDSRELSTAAPLLHSRHCCAASAYDGKIYVLGGRSSCTLSNAECYDPISNTWTELTRMLLPRRILQAVEINKCFYAVGNYRVYPSSIEKYNITEDEWSPVVVEGGVDMKVLWSAGVVWNQ